MSFDIKDCTQHDIQILVEKWVSKYKQKWPQNGRVASEIQRFISANNQGMYQWVSLVLDVTYRYGEAENDAIRALKDFPLGLVPM